MNTRILVRGALVIALALALQSIRLVLPLPPMAGAFIIGCFVHTMLIVAHRCAGLMTGLLLCLLLPCTAYMQGQLVLVLLIPIVAVGNIIYLLLTKRFTEGWKAYVLPPVAKACFMSAAFGFCALKLLHLDLPAVIMPVLFSMSVPQLVTGMAGVYLSAQLLRFARWRE